MDWTQIISSTIETGGLAAILITLVTLSEKKVAAMLENLKNLIERYKDLANEYQEREAKTQRLLEEKEAALLAEIKMNSSLRHSLDDAHTETAVLQVLRCNKTQCITREPPFGSQIDATIKESKNRSGKTYTAQQPGHENK